MNYTFMFLLLLSSHSKAYRHESSHLEKVHELNTCSVGLEVMSEFDNLLSLSRKTVSFTDPGKKKIEKYASQDKDYKIVKVIHEGATVTPTSIKYKFHDQRLKPGECIYLAIPEHLRNKPVLFVNLGHTQSYSDNTGYDHKTKWDKNPGLTTIQLSQVNSSGKSLWRYWDGLSSGDYGAKFAEPSHMELEGLYEWYKYGHKDIETHTNSKEALYVDGARLCSIGKDPVTIGSFIVKMAPARSDEYTEFNLSKSNVMGDPLTASGRNYGSRDDAVFLGGYDSKKLKEGLELKDGQLEMKLKKGMKLNSFEVSVGDKRANGDSGGARLSAYVLKANGEKINIIRRENVPPEGVLVGSPTVENLEIEEGDKLIVDSYWDKSFIMGLRVGYNK